MRKNICLFTVLFAALIMSACGEKAPEVMPTVAPTATVEATATPTVEPTIEVTPTVEPTIEVTPTVEPTIEVTPTVEPTIEVSPTVEPTIEATPTVEPTVEVLPTATVAPTATPVPTAAPTVTPAPTVAPTATLVPTVKPIVAPTATPTVKPTATPVPTVAPTATPAPTVAPTATPVPERVYPKITITGGEGEEPIYISEWENKQMVDFIDYINAKREAYTWEEYNDIGGMTRSVFDEIKKYATMDYVLDYWAVKVARQRSYMIVTEWGHLDVGGSEAITECSGTTNAGKDAATLYWRSRPHRAIIDNIGIPEYSDWDEEWVGYGFWITERGNWFCEYCSYNDGTPAAMEWGYYTDEMVAWREAHPEMKGIAY